MNKYIYIHIYYNNFMIIIIFEIKIMKIMKYIYNILINI
jgi:hypothetical protein